MKHPAKVTTAKHEDCGVVKRKKAYSYQGRPSASKCRFRQNKVQFDNFTCLQNICIMTSCVYVSLLEVLVAANTKSAVFAIRRTTGLQPGTCTTINDTQRTGRLMAQHLRFVFRGAWVQTTTTSPAALIQMPQFSSIRPRSLHSISFLIHSLIIQSLTVLNYIEHH